MWWQAIARTLGFASAFDETTNDLVVYGHGRHFTGTENPWKDAVLWWFEP